MLIKTLPGDPPQRVPKIGIRLLKLTPRTSESVILEEATTLKTGCFKKLKNEKNIFEKVNLTTVSHFRPPQSRLLEKRVPET